MVGFLNLNPSLLAKLNSNKITFSSKDFVVKSHVKAVKNDYMATPFRSKFPTKIELESIAKTNLCIVRLFQDYKLPIQVNIDELIKLEKGHLENTKNVVLKIYSSLPSNLKKDVNIFNLQTAALYHDLGKVLIPNNILNKKGKFTPDEREIMELHSIIGYELLKNQGLNKNVLSLIKYHHQNLQNKGYPFVEKGFDFAIDYQILSIADKYTALREARCYKNPFGKYEALEIIAKEVNAGLISQEIYTALIRAV